MMRKFDYAKSAANLLTPEIVRMLTAIHEYKGRQDLFIAENSDEFNTLLEVAMIQSTGASNRIEGIYTSDRRLEELVHEKAEPHNRSEEEIARYPDFSAPSRSLFIFRKRSGRFL